ncbi:MAG: hypothetical protein AB1730_15820 [Myxococcota bacterium]
MTRTRGLPQWLMVLLVLAAIVVLGPPVAGLLVGLVGLAVGLAAVALKVGLVALAVFAVVALFRAIFGGPSRSAPVDATSARIARLEQDDSRRALDEELARAVAASKK